MVAFGKPILVLETRPPPPPPPTIRTHPHLFCSSQATCQAPAPPNRQTPSRPPRPGSYIPRLTCPTSTVPSVQYPQPPQHPQQPLQPPPALHAQQSSPQPSTHPNIPTEHVYTAPTRPPGLSTQPGQYPSQLFHALNHQRECPGCVHERFYSKEYSTYHWPACRWLEARARMGNAVVEVGCGGWRNVIENENGKGNGSGEGVGEGSGNDSGSGAVGNNGCGFGNGGAERAAWERRGGDGRGVRVCDRVGSWRRE